MCEVLNELGTLWATFLTGDINISVEVLEILNRVDDSGTAPGSDYMVWVFGFEPGWKGPWIAASNTDPLGSDSELSLDFRVHVVYEVGEISQGLGRVQELQILSRVVFERLRGPVVSN